VITDRELDAQLADAAGVHDADLPALPEDFLGHVMADAGLSLFTDDGVADEPASVIAARQLVADAHATRTANRLRRRRPGRKTLVRVGVAVVAIAAAWTTAVAVAPPDRTATPDHTATPSEGTAPPSGPVGANGITLVAAEEVTFPLSLDPEPTGLRPTFSRRGGVPYFGDAPAVFVADYSSADGDRVLLGLFSEDPRGLEGYGWSAEGDPAGTVSVDGTEAEVRSGDSFATVLWERSDGRWVSILGEGAYRETTALVAVAETVVDRPQPVGLQFGLAPAGWSLGGYEESRSLDLVSDTDPEQLPLRLSLFGGPGFAATIDGPFEGRALAGPIEPVTIKGLPARMALADGDEGGTDTWLVAGQLPDGPLFLLVAPPVLTREQVLEIAEQITYTP
jgi:hypothetical protein